MMNLPLVRDLVLVGGGHTHALVLRKWGMNPLAGVRVTLINPGPTAPYSGMLPGFVAGHYTRDELDIDLVKLVRFAGARLINGAVTEINRDERLITVPGRPPIAYDVCALDVGITSDMPGLPGFTKYAVPAKPLGAFASRWEAFIARADDADIAVIGGGVAGAELAMAMSFAMQKAGKTPRVRLIERGKILTALGDVAQTKMRAALAANDIEVLENVNLTEITKDGLVFGDGTVVPSQFTTGAAGAKPHDWQAEIGLDLHDGYINVDAALQSSDPAIFAVGDCAHLTASPRPKAGVFAVREAPFLFNNLRAVLSDGSLRHYKPQADYLKLISLGDKIALAEKFGTARSGKLLWRWKNQIDRKFMDQFAELPAMARLDVPTDHASGLKEALGDKPMCGGCGAKVGRGALQSVLASLDPPERDDVQMLAGDDAGVLKTGGVQQVISTDHLRAFTQDAVLMTKVAAAHALGDIWAMGAKPQAVTVNVILPRMSTELQRRTLSEIMEAAQAVIAHAGAAIAGGHSSLGDELTIGFTATGLCPQKPISLSDARAGDKLILTKPIGSGVILAAEMAGRARSADVIAAFDAMVQGQGNASGILSSAHAMTDVTGFGLAGHLRGICDASDVGASLSLDHLPLMAGAELLAETGMRSSLHADNVAGAGAVTGTVGPRMDLLFDPQTAGGLLAAVDPAEADRLVGELKNAGYAETAIIGSINEDIGAIIAS